MKVVWIVLLVLILATACASPQATGEAPVTGEQATPAGVENSPTAAAPAAPADVVTECANIDVQQLAAAGQAVYADNCAGCHGPEGQGQGDFPPLAGSAGVTVEDIPSLITAYFSVPGHPMEISNEDVAAVLTYTRSAFGNNALAVCPEFVLENRPAQ